MFHTSWSFSCVCATYGIQGIINESLGVRNLLKLGIAEATLIILSVWLDVKFWMQSLFPSILEKILLCGLLVFC